MASLVQCDRCSFTWKPDDYISRRRDVDLMLCTASVSGPATQGDAQPAFRRAVDLCQKCARELVKWLDMPSEAK